MLDQSFSSKSFREIFDIENRKGNNLESRFKEEFEASIKILEDIKKLQKTLTEEKKEEHKLRIKEEILELKKKRIKEIQKVFEQQDKKIKKHKIVLKLGGNFGGQCYLLEENLLNFFISKKIQYNINRNYKVKQASRYNILSAFINIVDDGFPKYIIRTDIKKFYESVPQKSILKKIEEDHLLSISTVKYIQQIFHEYNRLTNQSEDNAIGLPRGIGISAYLSELFMRDIDNQIKDLDDLVYYARYVDDIVAVFIPKSTKLEEQELNKYKDKIKKIVEDKEILLNEDKTECFNLLKDNSSLILKDDDNIGINFLGYKIRFKNNNTCSIQLSDKRIKKYLKRINSSFSHFEKKKSHNRKTAFKLLDARIRYLTSNTKLRNAKSGVFVGIYYTNSFLNNDFSLKKLDTRLEWKIARAGLNEKEKNQLKKYSFTKGFQNKIFQVLPLRNKIYRNHNNRNQDNNKGVLQFGITEINSIWKNEK